jgi:hypothetical protein
MRDPRLEEPRGKERDTGCRCRQHVQLGVARRRRQRIARLGRLVDRPSARGVQASVSVIGRLPVLTPRRKKVALAIAAVADALQLGLFPVFSGGVLSIPDDALDLAVAAALIATVGFEWRLVIALGIELVPGVALFPTWTAMVATLPTDAAAPPWVSTTPRRGKKVVQGVPEAEEARVAAKRHNRP